MWRSAQTEAGELLARRVDRTQSGLEQFAHLRGRRCRRERCATLRSRRLRDDRRAGRRRRNRAPRTGCGRWDRRVAGSPVHRCPGRGRALRDGPGAGGARRETHVSAWSTTGSNTSRVAGSTRRAPSRKCACRRRRVARGPTRRSGPTRARSSPCRRARVAANNRASGARPRHRRRRTRSRGCRPSS